MTTKGVTVHPLDRLGWTVTPSGCWEFNSKPNKDGYGRVKMPEGMRLAHRMAYERWISCIPPTLCVCHTCDNPPCINPAHLFLGTHTENHKDMEEKSRHQHGTSHHNAKLTKAQVQEIRKALSEGVRGVDLAQAYEVTKQEISKIKLNQRWLRSESSL